MAGKKEELELRIKVTGAQAVDQAIADLEQLAVESKTTQKALDVLGKAYGAGFDPSAGAKVITNLREQGATIDDITAKADELAAAMKKVDAIRLEGAESGLHRVSSGTDDVSRSARGANSALANMIGNTTQDLGELGGIVGSLGVGIGQMGEYAADAALDGEALGKSLTSMAAVAGPIAALSLATFAASKAIEAFGSKSKKTAEQTKEVAETILEESEAVDALNTALEDLNDGLSLTADQQLLAALFKDAPEEATKTSQALDTLGISAEALGPIMAAMEADSEGALSGLAQSALGANGPLDETTIHLANMAAAAVDMTESGEGAFAMFSRLAEQEGIPDVVIDSFHELILALEQINDAQQNTDVNQVAREQLDYAEALAQVNVVAQEALDLAKQRAGQGASDFDVWRQYTDIINRVRDAFAGLNPLIEKNNEDQQIAADLAAAIAESGKAQTDAVAQGIQAWKEYTTAVTEASIAVGDILDQDVTRVDLSGPLAKELDEVDRLFDGLKFDVDFESGMADAMKDLNKFKPDLETLAAQWGDVLSGKDISIFGDVRSDDTEFLQWLGGIRDQLQSGVVNAFEQSGRESADKFLKEQAEAFASASGMSLADVYKIMGLPPDGSIEAIIEPIVDATHADQARGILDALATVPGGDAREARIHVALETGAVDGDIAFIAAQILAHEALGVPVKLDGFTQDEIDEAQAFLDGQIWTARIVPEVPPEEANRTDRDLLALAEDRTATYNTETPDADATNRRLNNVADGILGRIWPGGKGRLATYRTEAPGLGTLNAYLDAVAHERDVPFFARAHNVFATDQILDNLANPGGQARIAHINVVTHGGVSTGGGGGGPTPEPGAAGLAAAPTATTAASTVTASPTVFTAPAPSHTTYNVTLNAGVLGNHFDVERGVNRALRRHQRINGRRN